ncbi:hypothetical protein RUND412_006961 [Rhizina undulata]
MSTTEQTRELPWPSDQEPITYNHRVLRLAPLPLWVEPRDISQKIYGGALERINMWYIGDEETQMWHSHKTASIAFISVDSAFNYFNYAYRIGGISFTCPTTGEEKICRVEYQKTLPDKYYEKQISTLEAALDPYISAKRVLDLWDLPSNDTELVKLELYCILVEECPDLPSWIEYVEVFRVSGDDPEKCRARMVFIRIKYALATKRFIENTEDEWFEDVKVAFGVDDCECPIPEIPEDSSGRTDQTQYSEEALPSYNDEDFCG